MRQVAAPSNDLRFTNTDVDKTTWARSKDIVLCTACFIFVIIRYSFTPLFQGYGTTQ